jgi:PTS system nitrogen regulatory IIA component
MYLTIEEISRILRTSRSTVEQWIARMGLPVEEYQGERRCRAEELRRWLSEHKITIPDELMKLPGRAPGALPSFSDALERGGVFHNLPGRDKRTALAAAVGYLPLPESVPDEMLLQRLLDREEMVSTGVGDGIAIPHPREPLPQLPAPLAALCFPEKPLDFDAYPCPPFLSVAQTGIPRVDHPRHAG